MTAIQRALVVIDVQNEYFDGQLKIEYPQPAHSLENILSAMRAARAAGVPVILVQNSAPEASPIFARGSRGWELHPAIASQPRDLLVDKTLPSAFTGTGLGAWLKERGIGTITIAGYMTHNCDASTAIDAVHQGLAVEFLADATGSLPYANAAGAATAEEIHRVFCVVMHSRFAWTGSTSDWIAAAREGRPLQRGNIFDSNQAALARR